MSFRAGDFNKYGKVYRLSASATKDAAGHIDEMNDANISSCASTVSS